MRYRFRDVKLIVPAVLCLLASCGGQAETPPDLPELTAPIASPPPPPPKPEVDTIELTIVDSDGDELDELTSGQEFHANVEFEMEDDTADVPPITVQLGMYVDSVGFVTAWTRTMKPERDTSGTWRVVVPLRAAPHAGTFHVRAEATSERYVLIEHEIRIEKSED